MCSCTYARTLSYTDTYAHKNVNERLTHVNVQHNAYAHLLITHIDSHVLHLFSPEKSEATIVPTSTADAASPTKSPADEEVDRSSTFSEAELRRLPELRPPSVLPQGNVGTPTSTLLRLIAQCRFPPRLITKLGLKFPQARHAHRYANVPFEYPSAAQSGKSSSNRHHQRDDREVFTADGHALLENAVEEKQGKDKSSSDEENDTSEESEIGEVSVFFSFSFLFCLFGFRFEGTYSSTSVQCLGCLSGCARVVGAPENNTTQRC